MRGLAVVRVRASSRRTFVRSGASWCCYFTQGELPTVHINAEIQR